MDELVLSVFSKEIHVKMQTSILNLIFNIFENIDYIVDM
jgi:hypothetical protein